MKTKTLRSLWITIALSSSVFLLTGCAASVTNKKTDVPPILPADTTALQPAVTPKPTTQPIDEFDLAQSNTPLAPRIQIDDILKFVLPDSPDLTMLMTVQAEGTISVPSLGEVPVAGLTLEEARLLIRQQMQNNADTSTIRLKVNDIIKLQVWHEPELTHVATVQSDGKITLPLVGSIPAVGKTLQELNDIVRQSLSRYLNNAVVSILPVKFQTGLCPTASFYLIPYQSQPRLITVVGNVRNPGVVVLKGGSMRVLDVLAQAAYQNETSQLNSILVIRNMQKNPTYHLLKLNDYLDGKAVDQNIYLSPGDVVFVPKTAIAQVGDFIDLFFSRTKPIFDWWLSAVSSAYAVDLAREGISNGFYLSSQSQLLNSRILEVTQ